MRKLAIIRDEGNADCPYGLETIPLVCKMAGNSVEEMIPLDTLDPDIAKEDKQKVINKNRAILENNKHPNKCKYANLFFKDVKAVNCNYGEPEGAVGDPGVPLQQPYSGNLQHLNEVYTLPYSYYSGGTLPNIPIYDNPYYNIWNWAHRNTNEIIKNIRARMDKIVLYRK